MSWDDEQGICAHLESPRGETLLIELEPLNSQRPCWARTAHFNVNVRQKPATQRPLSAEHVRVGEAFVRMVRIRERTLRMPEVRPTSGRQTEVTEVTASRMLVAEGAGRYYLNPYVGCMIGCRYCYVMDRANLSRRLAGRPHHPWGRWVDVKVDVEATLAREIAACEPGIVRLSPIITDPYMPLERHYRTTRRCLEMLLPAGFQVVILTRSGRVLDDLDLFEGFPGQVAIGLSIPSDDDALRALFEPRADTIEARFEALATLHEAGVNAFAVIQPMLPMNEARLADQISPYVTTVRIDRMHDAERVADLYERAAIPEATTDAFFRTTEARLRTELSRRGVRIDGLDDLSVLFDRTGPPG